MAAFSFLTFLRRCVIEVAPLAIDSQLIVVHVGDAVSPVDCGCYSAGVFLSLPLADRHCD
jgi:hypothetical protein